MSKLIVKQFFQHWKIWLAVLPLFIVSGLVFGTAFTLINGIPVDKVSAEMDFGVFLQTPIVIGGLVLCLLTVNAMKQCIDLFDDTNDILLLLGASPLQLSLVMTGQMLLIGFIGSIIGFLFSTTAAYGFIRTLPIESARPFFSQLHINFSLNILFITIFLQSALIVIPCMRYCLKNYKKRKGSLSLYNDLTKQKNSGLFIGIIALVVSISATVFLYLKKVPNPTVLKEYTSSMGSSVNVLLLLWLSLLISMNFLIRPLFKGIVHQIVDLPSMTKYPMIRSSFYNMNYNVEDLVKLIRPVSVITLLIGNFIALFLNTKLLIDGRNDNSYLGDLVMSLIFVFGAPILISIANILASIGLFRIKTKDESEQYFFSGYTPSSIFKVKFIEIGTTAIISIFITLFGTFLFAIPLLRVTYLGGGDIFKANWWVNILLSSGAFFLLFLFFILMYWSDSYDSKKYIESH